jgi:hypothetical protein
MLAWLHNLFAGNGPGPRGSADPGAAAYQHLRSQAFSVDRASAGIPAPSPDAPVWGVIMEMGFPNGTATLLALADGTTSLYYSSGGGVIGGQGYESVRRANAALLAEANRLVSRMTPTSTCPLPAARTTTFYARTDSGVLAGGGADEDLGHGRHDLSSLLRAGHGVLTELRLLTERGGPGP